MRESIIVKEGLILVCRESVYIFENIMLFYNFMTVLKYKGKHKYCGIIMQIIFLYFFEHPLQYI